MAAGVALYLTERHAHEHRHEALTHAHLTSTTHIISASTIFRGTEQNPMPMNTATASSRMSIRTIRTCTTGKATPDAPTTLCPTLFKPKPTAGGLN